MELTELNLVELLTMTPMQGLAVVIATIIMYLFLLLLLKVLGPRVAARLSTYDMAALVIIGAIAGRGTLGHTPTLSAAVIALVTLFLVRWIFSLLKVTPIGDSLMNNPPTVVMIENHIRTAHLRHLHVSEADMWTSLRHAGVRNDSEIAAVILEPDGQFSVLRKGISIDRRILSGVAGAEAIPAEFLES